MRNAVIEKKLMDLAIVAGLVALGLAALHLAGVLPVWCLARAATAGGLLMFVIGLVAIAGSAWRDTRILRMLQMQSRLSPP